MARATSRAGDYRQVNRVTLAVLYLCLATTGVEGATEGELAQKRDSATAPDSNSVLDLPLIEVPTTGYDSTCLAFFISGDGGWGKFESRLSEELAHRGVPVIGMSAFKYCHKRRTPDETGRDLGRILRHYMAVWKRDTAIVIGYSRGADILPFMVNRLPTDLRSRVSEVVLIGPQRTIDFKWHVLDWFATLVRESDLPVGPEVLKLTGMKILCVHGDREDDTLCRDLDPATVTIISRKGGHALDGDFKALAEILLSQGQK